MRLVDDARQMLFTLGQKAMVKARVGLFDCNSDGDDICIVADNGGEARIPCLRQQHSTEGKPNWCMADFIRPKEQGISDRIGVFATTVDFIPEEEYAGDSYNTMLSQTLCDRLAEAAACLFHKEVRTSIWGYSPDEELSIEDMLRERNQGIRPAVGYPSLPDQSLNFIMSPLIQMDELGIKLTENGAMKPHASVCGLMIAHPKADYFMIGKIDHNQFADYAERRGLPLEQMRKFLAGNLE